MAVNKRAGYNYINDKCNPPPKIDMGTSVVFAEALPGLNPTGSRPFGWTEYESAYRHQYIPARPAPRPCKDPCKPKGVGRKPPPREFAQCGIYPRSTICELCMSAKCRCPIPPPWQECKEKVMVYDPDNVRTLLVKGELKNEHPLVISNSDYCTILEHAKVQDKESKAEECLRITKEKEAALALCRERANEMRELDELKFKSTLSPEAQEDQNEILCRADTILKEDEPEVRSINKVILAAKVQAIREAQLQEKEMIRCEQAEENRRLDALMEQDKEFALIKDDDKELEEMEQKKRELKASIQAQLDEAEAMKYYIKERKEREDEELQKYWEKFDLLEAQKRQMEKEKMAKLGVELLENQMLAIERMRREKEIDKELDQKMIEYQRQKAAEYERLEKEKATQKRLKELAIKQVLDTQKRSSDSKALRDELRARRHQEQQEREWRRREREQVLKRRRAAEELKAALAAQIRQQQEWVAEQAAYEKEAFDNVYEINGARIEEEKAKEEERKERNAQYKLDLREQIHRFQIEKIRERRDFYVEGIKLRKGLGGRETELRCLMEEKVDKLRECSMPEKYIRYIKQAVDQELLPEWKRKISKM